MQTARGILRMSDADSVSSAPPPSAQPATIAAEELRAAHPLWQKAAAHGKRLSSAKRNESHTPASRNGDGTRYEPLSALALELDGFRNNTDGDSALLSDSDAAHGRHHRKRHCEGADAAAAAAAPPSEDARYAHEEDSSEGEEGGSDGNDRDDGTNARRKKRQRTAASGDAAMYAQAAFGVGYEAHDSDDESNSYASGTSSQRKHAAYKAAFPIKGIECVGCMLVKQIAPVVRFIKANLSLMSDDALFKQAALVYMREVQEPRHREGVATPSWNWKDLRTHFLLHCSDNQIARTATIRQLQTMRYAVEARLMRVNEGERELDVKGADMILKVHARRAAPCHTMPCRPNRSATARGCADYQGGERAARHSCRRVFRTGAEGNGRIHRRRCEQMSVRKRSKTRCVDRWDARFA